MITLGAETFANRNFRNFRDFSLISRKFMPSKKVKRKIRESYFRKNKTFNKNRESFFPVLKAEKPKIKKGLSIFRPEGF